MLPNVETVKNTLKWETLYMAMTETVYMMGRYHTYILNWLQLQCFVQTSQNIGFQAKLSKRSK